MKRPLLLITIFAMALLGIVALTTSVSALKSESSEMTEAHVARIRSNCVDAQTVLFRLHASDAGMRVNQGQLYESISNKLMTPLNSRIVMDRLGGASLVSTTAEYERQLQEFRLQYKSYEEAMSATLGMDCVNQPVSFYDSVIDTRRKRQLTHDSTMALKKSIQKYSDEFELFVKDFQANES